MVLLPALAACAWLAAAPVATSAIQPTGEVRGLWVGRASLTSRASITAMVGEARAMGVNTLFVQVRGRGEAFYRSRLEPRASELSAAPADFDPLEAVLAEARAAGLRVHAWINVNLVAGASWMPGSPAHVGRRHPDWLMAPRALAASLARRSPRSADYLADLARWTAGASQRVEGLYLSPLVPAARDHTIAVVDELVRAYRLDGLHLDYIRYPGPDFDYSSAALAEFRRAQIGRGVPAADRQRLDRAARGDPSIWTRTYPASWTSFREAALTTLVARLRAVAVQARPGLALSAAVLPDPERARLEKLQDWAAWADAGYLDAVCPMLYTTDAAEFRAQVAAIRTRLARGGAELWAGIGAYRLPAVRTVAHVRTARQQGAEGIVLFSYEQLSAQTADTLPAVRNLLRSALVGPAEFESR